MRRGGQGRRRVDHTLSDALIAGKHDGRVVFLLDRRIDNILKTIILPWIGFDVMIVPLDSDEHSKTYAKLQ